MANYCQRLGPFGVRSMRNLAGQFECPSTCASNFRFKEGSYREVPHGQVFSVSLSFLFPKNPRENEGEAKVEH